MKFQYNDGGRAAAGFKGSTGDCAVRALAIAVSMDYQTAYSLINAHAELTLVRGRKSNARTGVFRETLNSVLTSLGWRWVPVMKIGKGCTMHVREDEIPPHPRMILRLSRHYVAVVDGVIQDTYEDARDGTRCVYGYWYV